MLIPPAAADAWRHLSATLADLPPVVGPPGVGGGAGGAGNGTTRTTTRAAQATCTACPARAACLAYANAAHEEFGIWGGTTPSERTTMRPQATAA